MTRPKPNPQPATEVRAVDRFGSPLPNAPTFTVTPAVDGRGLVIEVSPGWLFIYTSTQVDMRLARLKVERAR